EENNLVIWQDRRGPGSSEHRVLLDARRDANLRLELERRLFDLFKGVADEGATFGLLKDALGAKYPLLAYFFFLKDMRRFMPIRPTIFDRAFRDLGIDLVTARKCSWENYQHFNAALREVRSALAAMEGLKKVRLIDAHSFCWMLEKQLKEDREQLKKGREKSIIEMRQSVENTVRTANGQTVERVVKNKELRMTAAELTKLLRSLLDRQGNCCELTRIPFHFAGPDADDNRRPSVDRIDSNGHYEADNVQIVCRFVNSWKGESDNEEFKRLLALVQREGGAPRRGDVGIFPAEGDISSMAKRVRSSTRLADPA
ncbi:MAG: hypothetical protein OXQ28_10820, partial [Acidobacteriota bacterium]|nr:hypothetical protein [Acidobacteriota bacterium]